jgi:glutamate--cysteine ligase
MLEQGGRERSLAEWGGALLKECAPIAAALDAVHGGTSYSDAIHGASASFAAPETLPSARVLAAMQKDFAGSFIGFTRDRSERTRATLLALPFSDEEHARFAAASAESVEEQKRIEAADTMPFDLYREQYLRPDRLGLKITSAADAVVEAALQTAAL